MRKLQGINLGWDDDRFIFQALGSCATLGGGASVVVIDAVFNFRGDGGGLG